ncbi:hypothetical protein AX774_g678 [Zancudomyces culisetae]|uniref:Uncharacterized protein n=1 Tax=Zancudomyces culisetae TaxID=1213189 RepID=A0A1R1PXP8_ZANCU|nr:hypothetical protein AX774_g678 [Zancudomyces culisetae]|eukprot:OMH85765.1 hypothetical protein AX774_g678 [Zancudomyces culisetae]
MMIKSITLGLLFLVALTMCSANGKISCDGENNVKFIIGDFSLSGKCPSDSKCGIKDNKQGCILNDKIIAGCKDRKDHIECYVSGGFSRIRNLSYETISTLMVAGCILIMATGIF